MWVQRMDVTSISPSSSCLMDPTICNPVSIIHRTEGKASGAMAESEGRNLCLQMTKWSRASHQPEPYFKLLDEKEIHQFSSDH